MTTSFAVDGGVLTDRSVTTVATTSTQLIAANALRRYFAVQAPQTSGVWLNLTGGTAAANGTGCLYLQPGQFYENNTFIIQNAVTYYCVTGSLTLTAWEG